MNCEEFRTSVLAGDESEATAKHELECASCRSIAADLRASALALGDEAVWAEPSPELGNRIEQLIAGSTTSPAPAVGAQMWPRLLAVAAVLVVVVGAIGILNREPAPDWEVALPGTGRASTASAVVMGWAEEAGTRMVVDIDGLEPAPAGFVYEFWLSDGPVHISAGTFSGPGEVELWSGVARAEFPRLWVTLEPIDDDESPSGDTVLDTG